MSLQNFSHDFMRFQLFVCALSSDPSILHYHNFIAQMYKVNCMRDQDPGLALANSIKHFIEDIFASVGVKRRNWIVHNQDVLVLVDSAGEAYSRFFPPERLMPISPISVESPLGKICKSSSS